MTSLADRRESVVNKTVRIFAETGEDMRQPDVVGQRDRRHNGSLRDTEQANINIAEELAPLVVGLSLREHAKSNVKSIGIQFLQHLETIG